MVDPYQSATRARIEARRRAAERRGVKHAMRLTYEQTAALRAFRRVQGRYWKRALSEAWDCHSYPGFMDGKAASVLHALRNTHGPAWLKRYILHYP